MKLLVWLGLKPFELEQLTADQFDTCCRQADALAARAQEDPS